jgi:hypothetical protein
VATSRVTRGIRLFWTIIETRACTHELLDMILERAALLPPLDEPAKAAKPPTQAQLRKAGKAAKLRVIITTPDEETMAAVKKHFPILGIVDFEQGAEARARRGVVKATPRRWPSDGVGKPPPASPSRPPPDFQSVNSKE